MPDYLIRLNSCPLFVLSVPETAALTERDARLLAREWLLGRPLRAGVRIQEASPVHPRRTVPSRTTQPEQP